MRLSFFTLVAGLAFTATADYNFSGGRGIECTGHDDGSISCTDSTDVRSDPDLQACLHHTTRSAITNTTNRKQLPTIISPSRSD